MKYRQGDRILYNRQKFGTVNSNQYNQTEVDVVFDREKSKIVAVRIDRLELVADAKHEATLSTLINSPVQPVTGLAGELTKLAEELSTGAEAEMNIFRLRTTMKEVSNHLQNIAKGL